MSSNTKNNYRIELIKLGPKENKKSDIFGKVEVIGDLGVGKTSLNERLIKDIFNENYKPTEGYEFYSYLVKINNIIVQFQIWDMSGKENYRSALFNLYRNAAVGILVYAVNNKKSFENCEEWIKQMKEYGPSSNKIFLIGNKNDDEQNRQVDFSKGQELCNKYGLDLFMEVSAKNGFSKPNFMDIAATKLYEDYLVYKDDYDYSFDMQNKSILLKSADYEIEQKKKCC